MHLLFMTPQLPYPAHQGTSLRNYHILRGLAGKHEISLLSLVDGDRPDELPPQLTSLCAEIVTVPAPQRSTQRRLWQILTSSQPDMALRLFSTDLSAALESMLARQQFDIAQIEGIELACLIPTLREFAPQLPIVYDAHNAETLLQSRSAAADRQNVKRWPAVVYSRVQSRRLAAYEAWACSGVDAVTAVSEADRRALQRQAGLAAGAVIAIPNSIDVASYGAAADEGQPDARFQFDVVFSGKMDYRPNVDAVLWFAEDIWPLIKEQKPEATWAIVGQKPHARLAGLETKPGVTVTGWVPEIKPYLAGAKVSVMPFRVGSGTRLKLIEALAAGRAVVSTPVGVEGFPVEDGRQILLGETASAFAERTLQLLDDPHLRAHLGQEGMRFAEAYDWRVVVPRFQQVYDGLVSGLD